MTIQRFEDVVAWQKGRQLNKKLISEFSYLSNFAFKDQLLRASLSITNNIAEGFERKSDNELRQFLYIARGSAGEVRSMLYIALDSGFLNEEHYQELMKLVTETGRLLTALIKSLQLSKGFKATRP